MDEMESCRIGIFHVSHDFYASLPPHNPSDFEELIYYIRSEERDISGFFPFLPFFLPSRDYLRPRPDSPLTRGVWTLPWKTAPPSPVTFNISAPTTTCSLSTEKRIPPWGSVIRKPLDTQSTRSSPAKWTKDTPSAIFRLEPRIEWVNGRARRRGGKKRRKISLVRERSKFVKSRGIGNHVFFVSLQRNVMKSLSFVVLFVTRNESFVYLFIVRASNRRALNRREERRINSNRSVSLHVYIYRCSIYLNICGEEYIRKCVRIFFSFFV